MIDVSRDDGILRLHLDKPKKRNVLDDEMVGPPSDAIDAAGRDESVRSILMTAEGDHFCSGFDIVARNAGDGQPRPRVGSIQRRLPICGPSAHSGAADHPGARRGGGALAGWPESDCTSRAGRRFSHLRRGRPARGAFRSARIHPRLGRDLAPPRLIGLQHTRDLPRPRDCGRRAHGRRVGARTRRRARRGRGRHRGIARPLVARRGRPSPSAS